MSNTISLTRKTIKATARENGIKAAVLFNEFCVFMDKDDQAYDYKHLASVQKISGIFQDCCQIQEEDVEKMYAEFFADAHASWLKEYLGSSSDSGVESDNSQKKTITKKTKKTKESSGRPRGRAPKGMVWDNETQDWISNGQPVVVKSKRPRGRAPKGQNGQPMIWSEDEQEFVEN